MPCGKPGCACQRMSPWLDLRMFPATRLRVGRPPQFRPDDPSAFLIVWRGRALSGVEGAPARVAVRRTLLAVSERISPRFARPDSRGGCPYVSLAAIPALSAKLSRHGQGYSQGISLADVHFPA